MDLAVDVSLLCLSLLSRLGPVGGQVALHSLWPVLHLLQRLLALPEWLVARALGLELVAPSVKGYDAVSSDGARYQVKGRRQTPENASRQLSAIRGFELDDVHPFDFLVGVLYNRDFTVMKAAQIPVPIVRQEAKPTPHVNGWRFLLRDAIRALPGVASAIRASTSACAAA